MKTVLLYLQVLGKSDPTSKGPEYYEPFTERFIATYTAHKPLIDHELAIGVCQGRGSHNGRLNGIASRYCYYEGAGWDIGAYQEIGKGIDADLLVCMATPLYFWRDGWLEPIVAAAQRHGPGLYGPMASNENTPHIRTSCFAFHPKMMRDYPLLINTRQKDILFESCTGGFTDWCTRKGYPVYMVTETGCYSQDGWRRPQNIFRRGDQSNCLVWDRHTDIYAKASPEEKYGLERSADHGR